MELFSIHDCTNDPFYSDGCIHAAGSCIFICLLKCVLFFILTVSHQYFCLFWWLDPLSRFSRNQSQTVNLFSRKPLKQIFVFLPLSYSLWWKWSLVFNHVLNRLKFPVYCCHKFVSLLSFSLVFMHIIAHHLTKCLPLSHWSFNHYDNLIIPKEIFRICDKVCRSRWWCLGQFSLKKLSQVKKTLFLVPISHKLIPIMQNNILV